MDEMERDRWSHEAGLGLADLPRARWPRPDLEDEVVAALRERGYIASPRASAVRGPWRYMVAAAAAIAFFASGVLVGQTLEASEVGQPGVAVASAPDAQRSIADVQRASNELVSTLARSAEASQSDPILAANLKQAAVFGLHAIASEVVRIVPGEPVASDIMSGFARAVASQVGPDNGTVEGHVVWF